MEKFEKFNPYENNKIMVRLILFWELGEEEEGEIITPEIHNLLEEYEVITEEDLYEFIEYLYQKFELGLDELSWDGKELKVIESRL